MVFAASTSSVMPTEPEPEDVSRDGVSFGKAAGKKHKKKEVLWVSMYKLQLCCTRV